MQEGMKEHERDKFNQERKYLRRKAGTRREHMLNDESLREHESEKHS